MSFSAIGSHWCACFRATPRSALTTLVAAKRTHVGRFHCCTTWEGESTSQQAKWRKSRGIHANRVNVTIYSHLLTQIVRELGHKMTRTYVVVKLFANTYDVWSLPRNACSTVFQSWSRRDIRSSVTWQAGLVRSDAYWSPWQQNIHCAKPCLI